MKRNVDFIAHPKNKEEVALLKTFLEDQKIKFEITDVDQSPYNSEFVNKIEKSQKDLVEGRGTKMSATEFKELCK